MIGQECRITIVYERFGTISESFVFKPAKLEEKAHIWLAQDSNTWKVHINANQYGLPPHVGIEAIRNWLHSLMQPSIDVRTSTKAKRLLETVESYH